MESQLLKSSKYSENPRVLTDAVLEKQDALLRPLEDIAANLRDMS